MTKQEALDLLFNASGLAPLNRDTHYRIQEAYQLLKPLTDDSDKKPK